MKKIILCLFFLATAVLGFSQSQRFVMFEECTQASCGPCAQQNPAFDALLFANPTKCTSIKYHTSWPGVDPMNQQNPTDVAIRVSYYGITGVPDAVMDGAEVAGSAYLGAPANVTQAMIDAEYAVPSPFTLSMYHYLSAGSDTIFVTMLGQCTQAVSGTLMGQIGVIEKHIHFNSPPGSNGEKDFYNVMKKMLPTASGNALASSYAPGDYFIVQGSWKLANIYQMNQLGAVGFIQNNADKNIKQAANSDSIIMTMPFNNDAEMMGVSNYSTTNCSGTIAPVVTIRNNGNHPVTSMTIKYFVNGGAPASYTWNGNLTTLMETKVTLPAYTFTPGATNTMKVYDDQVNNVNDEYPKNDTSTITFIGAPVTTNYALLFIRTDNSPQETTWDLKNSSGTVIQTGGPYTQANHLYSDTLHIAGEDCYTYTIYDAGGNGLCCSNGSGLYQIKSSSGTVIKQGQSFGSSEFTEFKMDWVTAVQEFEKNGMKVYPNPFSGVSKVTFYLQKAENVVLDLYNSTGQLVKSINEGAFPSGDQECTLDAGNLPSGIYMLKMQAGAQVHICKISVNN
jgi:hypothetical protein